jgi:hypothetical protein
MMMKKRKFGSGGPTSADRAASKAQDAMMKKITPTKSEAKTLASAARSSKVNAKDLNAVKKYAKGGKVKKRYADGGMTGAGLDLEAKARRGEMERELGKMDFSTPKVEAPAKKAAAPAKKAAAPKPDAPSTSNAPEITVTGKRNPPTTPTSDIDAKAKKIMADRKWYQRPLTMAEAREEARKVRVAAPSKTSGNAERGARTLTERAQRVAKNATTEAAREKMLANRSDKDTPWYRSLPAKKKAAGGTAKAYAKGGSIDGCAVKGKTKGRII